MFILDDIVKGFYFSMGGKSNVRFVANQITHAAGQEFADYILNSYLNTIPSKDSIRALKHQLEANILSNKVSFNGARFGKMAIEILNDLLNE